ncbi:MAG: serine protease [Gammaproteobacteria bacterium]|nr:serine protease [Gammaproteobacteria bacterium]
MTSVQSILLAVPALLASFGAVADIQQRIIGGVESSIDRWPSMAALVAASNGTATLYQRQFCGGNLIDERWVLSAAHCFFQEDTLTSGWTQIPAEAIRVVLGTDNLLDDAEELVVTNIITHPDYEPGNNSSPNDIALIELANTSEVPAARVNTGSIATGTEAVVMGWGATRYDPFTQEPSNFPTFLREVEVPVVSNSTCNASSSYSGLITSTQMCAGEQAGGKDSCSGDSGGPLMIEENGEYVQAGIVSFGNGCALANYYGVYTRVSSFVDWIDDYVGNGISGSGVPSGGSDNRDKSDGLGAGFIGLYAMLLLAGLLRGRRPGKSYRSKP